ncbi:MAG: MFS transporter [Janthinobacterium lividum]
MPSPFQTFRQLQPVQRRAFTACFLGWTLDAFDFFLLTYTLDAVAVTFGITLKVATTAIFWTLCMRPVGALLFGWMAERYGRRPTLMINIVCFSVFELASAFAPSFRTFLVFRALFGIAMGGEWGVGSALALETLPAENRGFFGGLLQEGYAAGNLLAAGVYGLVSVLYHGQTLPSWRLLFLLGALPSLLVVYIRSSVKESPAWLDGKQSKRVTDGSRATLALLRAHLPVLLMLMLLMTGLNSLSHGSQDLYPTFLKTVHHLSPRTTSLIAIIATLGALCGGPVWGMLSERWGRRRALAGSALLAIPVVPLWIWSHSLLLLALGGFLMQFMVQGAWGIVPTHLNELSPAPLRAMLPGLAYQLGNLISSRNAVLQTAVAMSLFGGSLAPVLAWTVGITSVFVAIVAWFGREARGADLSTSG